MQARFFLYFAALFAGSLLFPMPAGAVGTLFSDSGNSIADIEDTVAAFRTALGNPNNLNNPGPLPAGRREINWDGGSTTNTATTPSGTPFSGFLNTRGAQFTTPGTGFVQAPPADGSTPLGGLDGVFSNPTYATTFAAFSPQRLFTPVASNVTEVFFSIPGTNGAQQASVTSFGAVFSDVDLLGPTLLQYFGLSGASLGSFTVPNVNSENPTFSFLGVQFTDPGELISRVRITTGNVALGPTAIDGIVDTPNVDVVVMDDFIYSEPRAVPEPFTILLLGVGMAGVWVASRRRASAV